MNDHGGGWALVTGASSGIGRELARQLAAEGFSVVLVARDAEALRELGAEIESEHAVTARVLPKDLRAPEAAREIHAELESAGVEVSVLVNDAGVAPYDQFRNQDPQELIDAIQLNVAALTALTSLFLPQMLVRRSGRILNVGSGAGFCPVPSLAVYAATKAYVLSLTESLAQELKGTGVSVTCLCPWPTRSAIQERAGIGEARAHRWKLAEPADVARVGLAALKRGRAIAIPGLGNRLQVFGMRFSPRRMNAAVAGWMFQRV